MKSSYRNDLLTHEPEHETAASLPPPARCSSAHIRSNTVCSREGTKVLNSVCTAPKDTATLIQSHAHSLHCCHPAAHSNTRSRLPLRLNISHSPFLTLHTPHTFNMYKVTQRYHSNSWHTVMQMSVHSMYHSLAYFMSVAHSLYCCGSCCYCLCYLALSSPATARSADTRTRQTASHR